MLLNTLVGAALLPIAWAQSGAYGQCGGIGWTGATTCISGWTCTYENAYYSQCLPSASSTQTTTTKITSSSTSSASSPTTAPTSSATGLGSPSSTLLPNYYWIRAVESPNFHSYLQSNPPQQTGAAVMNSYTTAGQFNVVNGNLVQVLSSGALLYGVVEHQANSSVTKLLVSWETTSANVYGTFNWSGDALQWSVANITRPNNSAWLVCESQHLYVNLGAYDYMTPAGCADETIHYYNGATAVD
ncbi:hypothetical protein DL93DRAFT_1317094 [Clavulina sp. PMI_390]|nr:hypothetical protein DL93DRAFT_1317094 [Clavulina sp. PMI_390]